MSSLAAAAYGLGVGSRLCGLDWIGSVLPALLEDEDLVNPYMAQISQIVALADIDSPPNFVQEQLVNDFADRAIPKTHTCWVWYDIGRQFGSCVCGLPRRADISSTVRKLRECLINLPQSSAGRIDMICRLRESCPDVLSESKLLEALFGGNARAEADQWNEEKWREYGTYLLERIQDEIESLPGDQMSAPGGMLESTSDERWHSGSPSGTKYEGGRLEGELNELAAWNATSPQTLRVMNQSGGVWIQKIHRTKYAIFYQSTAEYESALRRSRTIRDAQTRPN